MGPATSEAPRTTDAGNDNRKWHAFSCDELGRADGPALCGVKPTTGDEVLPLDDSKLDCPECFRILRRTCVLRNGIWYSRS